MEDGAAGGEIRRLREENHRLATDLHRAETQAAAMLDAALDCVISIDHEGRVLAFNAAAERVFGYSAAEVIGRTMGDLFVPPAHREAHRRGLARVVASGESRIAGRRIELTALRRDGSEFPIELSVSQLRGAVPPVFVGTLRDITERRRTEALLERRARHAALAADVGRIMARADADLDGTLARCVERIVDALDAAFARIWVVDEADPVLVLRASAGLYTHLDGKHSRIPVGAFKIGQIAEEQRPHLTNEVATDPRISDPGWARREGMVAFAGYPLIVGSRLVGVMAMFARSTLSEDTLGALAAIADTVANGIERRRIEEERARLVEREREARTEADIQRLRLESLFSEAPASIALYEGPEHVVRLMNPAARRFLGIEPKIGRPLVESFPQLPRSDVLRVLDSVYLLGETFSGRDYEITFAPPGGEPRTAYFDFVAQPTRDGTGAITGVVSFAVDVTEQVLARRRVEILAAEIASEQQWLESLLDSLPVPTLLVDVEGGAITFANKAADRIAGGTFPRSPSREEYRRDFDVRDLEGRRLSYEQTPVARAVAGEVLNGVEFLWKVSPRQSLTVLVHTAHIPATHGHPATVVISFDDITRQKEIETELQRSLGLRDDFLSIASHELRNPINAMQLSLFSILRAAKNRPELLTPEWLVARMEKAGEQVVRLARLIDELLDVSRITAARLELHPEELCVHDLVRAAARRVETDFDAPAIAIEGPPTCPGRWDRNRLDRVFTNLLTNAIKYGEGKPVSVRIETNDSHVTVDVIDRGIGIPAENQARIFERFERAVPDRRYGGFGLGLWISREIVEAHGGHISVTSAPGEGSRFRVELPRDGVSS